MHISKDDLLNSSHVFWSLSPKSITNLFGHCLNGLNKSWRSYQSWCLCSSLGNMTCSQWYYLWQIISCFLFSRLLLLLLTGHIRGYVSSWRSSVVTWIFDATVTWFIFPVRLAAWSQTHKLIHWCFYILSLFRWLIHMSTLSDLWSVIICTLEIQRLF
jgi:hypothetical protein